MFDMCCPKKGSHNLSTVILNLNKAFLMQMKEDSILITPFITPLLRDIVLQILLKVLGKSVGE